MRGLIAAPSADALGAPSIVSVLRVFTLVPTFSYAADISRIYISQLLDPD